MNTQKWSNLFELENVTIWKPIQLPGEQERNDTKQVRAIYPLIDWSHIQKWAFDWLIDWLIDWVQIRLTRKFSSMGSKFSTTKVEIRQAFTSLIKLSRENFPIIIRDNGLSGPENPVALIFQSNRQRANPLSGHKVHRRVLSLQK